MAGGIYNRKTDVDRPTLRDQYMKARDDQRKKAQKQKPRTPRNDTFRQAFAAGMAKNAIRKNNQTK